ncbi:MAG: lamin tail domain-containing protein, partial [Gemmatimonadaceae bacterium]
MQLTRTNRLRTSFSRTALTRASTLRTNFARLASALLLALTVQACSDSNVVAPHNFETGAAAFNAVPGVPDFLAPLGTGVAVPATFDANAADRVVVCTWISNTCAGSPVAQFAVNPSTGVLPLVVNTAAGRYEATLNLMNTAFLTRKTYRIATMKGSTVLSTVLVDIIRGRWALSRNDGTLAPLVAATNLPIQFHVALPTIVINEVESNGDAVGDWVELTNTGSAPVDLSGFVIKDDDPTHSYTIASGTSILPGQFMAFYVYQSFGLGAADMARVFTPNGALVDSYAWTAHAATTYGRCPDATGAFTTMTTVTRGAANDCSVPNTVKINEVESSSGVPGDWMEVINTGVIPVNISGFLVKDDNDSHIFTIPANTILAPGQIMAFDTEVAYGFGAPDAVRLFNTSGTLLDSYAWATHATTTYGRCPSGTGAFTTTTSVTKGTANDCSVAAPPLKINEVESSGGNPGDWIELMNSGNAPANLGGYVLKDDNDTHIFTIPAGTTIGAGAYLAFDVESAFGLGAPDAARLFDPNGVLID